jgi:hypothetical protein
MDALHRAKTNNRPSFWSMLRHVLFDPANTSELYTAPRRFDLATLFVMTAAYSLLFGVLSGFNAVFQFGPLPLIILGLVVAVVGAAQALSHGVANPRGVSVVVGGAAFVLFCLLILVIRPQLFEGWLFIDIALGLVFAPVLGYFAGVLVGGVFLVADRLRSRTHEINSSDDTTEGGRQ